MYYLYKMLLWGGWVKSVKHKIQMNKFEDLIGFIQ